MSRLSALAGIAALLFAGGCLASSSTHTRTEQRTPRPYAKFTVRAVSFSCGRRPSFGRELCRAHFTLRCLPERTYMELADMVPNEKLCLAILDYQSQQPPAGAGTEPATCACPAPTPVVVDLRGTIRGRPIHERITSCGCNQNEQAHHDALVILGDRRRSVRHLWSTTAAVSPAAQARCRAAVAALRTRPEGGAPDWSRRPGRRADRTS